MHRETYLQARQSHAKNENKYLFSKWGALGSRPPFVTPGLPSDSQILTRHPGFRLHIMQREPVASVSHK